MLGFPNPFAKRSGIAKKRRKGIKTSKFISQTANAFFYDIAKAFPPCADDGDSGCVGINDRARDPLGIKARGEKEREIAL